MNFTPTEHVVCVIRERVGDILLGEGYGEASRLYADQLAVAYRRNSTLDVILRDLQFVLDEADFAGILGFCKLHYPILFETIPSDVRGVVPSLSRSQHTTTTWANILDSAALLWPWPDLFGDVLIQC